MPNWTSAETQRVWSSITSLDRWLSSNGWAGYDPYDIKGTPHYLYLIRQTDAGQLMARRALAVINRIESRFPLLLRQIFQVRKEINAKGMGLFLASYIDLFEISGIENYKNNALTCLEWLLENPSPGYPGLGWGYPFDWQSKILIPKGTPSAVVSCVIGDGFWRAYKVLQDHRYLTVCDDICHFLISSLNIDTIDNHCLCFSYTPIDNFHVHNANLFVAEFLIRIGNELNQQKYLDIGKMAANYALREQNENGSLYYWGKIQNHYLPNHIDHYHSGFEIRMLYMIWLHTQEESFKTATDKYYKYYLENLYVLRDEGNIIPKMTPQRLYPINIHSCAESILCNSTLAADYAQATSILPGLCTWIINTMQTNFGWFIYAIDKNKQREKYIQIPYIRWGQAWMARAMSYCLKYYHSHGELE